MKLNIGGSTPTAEWKNMHPSENVDVDYKGETVIEENREWELTEETKAGITGAVASFSLFLFVCSQSVRFEKRNASHGSIRIIFSIVSSTVSCSFTTTPST